jgi:environmental stress-induced protein Ves
MPFAFKGESAGGCRLITGPIRDFNLIYSPQRYHARLQWLDGVQPALFQFGAHRAGVQCQLMR